jgi:Pyruvate-formate lyase
MSLKTLAKKTVRALFRNTRSHQKRMAVQYYQGPKYTRLPDDERTQQRLCYFDSSAARQLGKLFSSVQIRIDPAKRFQHWIDTGLHVSRYLPLNGACPPNYDLILSNSIGNLIEENRNKRNKVEANNYELLAHVSRYIHRIIVELDRCVLINGNDANKLLQTRRYFERMLTDRAETLEEAFQRILFWSSLFWQSGHALIGLGRLDKLLQGYPRPEGEELTELISRFYEELHAYYAFKSNVLLGDTGQLIVLGGLETDGSYFCNDLTHAFIKSVMGAHLPDPKVLLRVSDNMPEELLELSLECISTGVGCPLLSNDEIVIPALEKFGYTHEDACNYVTSACWEPFSYGKSVGDSNLAHINFAKCLEETCLDDRFVPARKFEDVEDIFFEKLNLEVDKVFNKLDKIKWAENPLLSLFTEGCRESGKDISEGGAIYSDYGILSIGMANAVDSLFNIKKLAFTGDATISLQNIHDAVRSNYGNEEKCRSILSRSAYFGTDEEEVCTLVEKITGYVSAKLCKFTNSMGGKIKFGLSSPSYVEQGKNVGATADGRSAKEPLSVHVSCKQGVPYTELVNFASRLDYSGNKSNGNVLDFFVSPTFIHSNFEKLMLFMKLSISRGFFQMQLNVVSSDTLIAAKKNPELFPDLIVRVWGFSSYFSDLPEQYKDILIQRALDSEKTA